MPALDTSKIDDDKFYQVKLKKPIEITPNNFANPGSVVNLRGDLVKTFSEDIVEAAATEEHT